MRESLYSFAKLDRMLSPKSIAVYGASTRAGSFGERTIVNLANFEGGVYPVNPKYEEIAGRKCYPSMAALPQSPDLVVIVTARQAVEQMVLDCVAAKAGGVLIYASGYSETSKPDRIEQQERLARIAAESGMPVVGPNCIGLYNLTNGMVATFTPGQLIAKPPYKAVGLVTQSGAMGNSLLQGTNSGLAISHVLTAGNSCDVDIADYVAYLAESPDCASIAVLMEGMSNPRRLIRAAEIAWARNKPIVIYKTATGEEGARAAVSHTGSLAGANSAYMAAFEQAGACVVNDLETLMETATMFAKLGELKAEGVAVISVSGGASIVSADKAEKYGVPLPQPSDATRAILEQHIPDFGSTRNPCDTTAQTMSNPQALSACAGAFMAEESYGAIVVPMIMAYDLSIARMKLISSLAAEYGKPAFILWMSLWSEGPGSREAETDPNLILFRSADRTFAAIRLWHDRERRRRTVGGKAPRLAAPDAAATAAALIANAGYSVLTERESKEVLGAYGVKVTGEWLAADAQAAVSAGDKLGYPVAMKVESPDIPHKTEAGVIRLNLKDADAVRKAFGEIMANAARVQPPAKINGVLVQQMMPSGLEVMVGASIDPMFGPLVVFGLGGVFVELLKDTVTAVAPVSPEQALEMLSRLKGQKAFDGFRGSSPVDRAALAETIARISELAADQAEVLAEFDVNPLICNGSSIVAVDGLLVRKDAVPH